MAYKAALRDVDSKIRILERQTNLLSAKQTHIDETSNILAAMVDACPLPMWIKDTTGSMMFFNESYAKTYGIDVMQYINQKDSSIWPKEIADNFVSNDIDVIHTSVGYKIEVLPTTNKHKPSSAQDYITVVKWRVTYEGQVIGVAGIVTSVFP